jgi:nucleoid DNA-binding protein
MTFAELVVRVSDRSGLLQSEVATVLRALAFEVKRACIYECLDVKIPGLGRFRKKSYRARRMTLPDGTETAGLVQTPPVITFKMSRGK